MHVGVTDLRGARPAHESAEATVGWLRKLENASQKKIGQVGGSASMERRILRTITYARTWNASV
jgi:hypothetical protein